MLYIIIIYNYINSQVISKIYFELYYNVFIYLFNIYLDIIALLL